MPRKPNKVHADADLVRVTVLLPADDVKAIDAEAKRVTSADPYGRAITRTDVIRRLLSEALRSK